MKSIRTRFAPSPTGFLHIGGLRTALFAYLFAKKEGGEFYLRIEDTDKERFVEGAVENIVNALLWAGIEIHGGVTYGKDGHITQIGDTGPYIQSERLEIYKENVQKLIESGDAYYAFDTSEELTKMRETQQVRKVATHYDRANMRNQITIGDDETKKLLADNAPYVIRLKVPEGEVVEFKDIVRGTISVHSREIDDQVLMKSDGYPTYHLANVVDDHFMKITHVIRGEEWLPSTPKHILLYKAFGWDIPAFAHLPLLINEQKQKLSKRHGDVSVEDFREKGYLVEALVNFITFLGWNPGDDQEIFSIDELEKKFTLEKVSKSSAVFNREKLDWYNSQYIKALTSEELAGKAFPFLINQGLVTEPKKAQDPEYKKWIAQVMQLEQGRSKTLSELAESVAFIFADELEYDEKLLTWRKSTLEDAKEKLKELSEILDAIEEGEWSTDKLQEIIMSWIKEKGYGNGDVLWPMRVALSGKKNSPGPFEIAGVLGKEKSLKRIKSV